MPTTSTRTKIVATGGTSRSIRTVIPMWIAETFDFKAGDTVVWKMKVEDGKMRLYVEKGDDS
mgnify:FL=1|tara:strand:- start:461 stop:646 length:186 start_codon:yes stop_codon:yes gene_type:complete